MKKMMMLALALVMMLTLTGAVLAESAPMSKEDQMKNMVQGFLDENGYEYEYDDYTFSMSFALENAVEEHILCHKGAYMGKNGITRDRTGKPWYYRNLKR